ncbi:MAG: endonuclease/exonuclease/phosphatase family protein, partial [Planctomycetes bacterium]|nr:endonuclease/exonuclease/phosphatase family protein [Planctomycetota bacterium]
MRRILSILTAIFCASIAGVILTFSISASAAASEVTLRVMSWNCHKGGTAWNGADQVTGPTAEAQKMFESGADVIGLQEVRAPHRTIFKAELERLSGATWY